MEQLTKQNLPNKACMVTIMFIPDNDHQAIEVKAKLDKALEGVETQRYSFSFEQRNTTPKPVV